MKALPPAARLYLICVWLCAFLILAVVLATQALSVSLVWLGLWLIGFVLADYFEVSFERISMTLAESVIIFLVAVTDLGAVPLVALGTLLVELMRRRTWYRLLFNVANRVITVGCMAVVFMWLSSFGGASFSSPFSLMTFAATAATFYLSNTLLVGLIVALATGAPVRSVYHDSYQLVQWIHLLTLPIGALMAAHWVSNRWLLVFDVLVLLIAQRSFVMVAQLQTESQRRQELADERERLLKELQAQQAELIRASKLAALGTFSSGIAHEFNNLLAVVLGQAQIGLVTDDPEEMRESLDRIIKASRRGRSITNGLLTFARQGESQRTMVSLHDVIDDTLDMVEHDFAKEHVVIVRKIQAVPPTYCDQGQIVQVLLNMLSNARDAMRERGGGTITISLRQEQQQLALAIADTGTGIPADMLQQLFQPFVSTKGAQGTGLGLAICYGIIESHNGSIQVDSTVGSGTTMTIRIPIIERAEPPILLTTQDETRLANATSDAPERIYQ